MFGTPLEHVLQQTPRCTPDELFILTVDLFHLVFDDKPPESLILKQQIVPTTHDSVIQRKFTSECYGFLQFMRRSRTKKIISLASDLKMGIIRKSNGKIERSPHCILKPFRKIPLPAFHDAILFYIAAKV
jgi:hypothetical protein